MKTIQKLTAIFLLTAMLAFTFATPALAYEGRTGETVVIEEGDVINDDLYANASEFTLEGTIKGDLVVFAEIIYINGVVEGDLIAAGNTIVIAGEVKDDVRMAGAALQIAETANVGGDVIAASASLENKAGSTVGNDLMYAGAQALLAGDVEGNASVAVGGLEVRGNIAGNLTAEVGNAEDGAAPPSMYMGDVKINVPSVMPGLTISEEALIKGDLTYTQSVDFDIPAGVVAGKVTRNEPVVNEDLAPAPPTPAERAANWTFDLLRTIATLAIFGLLLAWLTPAFLKGLAEKLQAQPAPSFGWGIVAYAAFFFLILLVIITMIVAGVIFGVISLGSISGVIIWVGLLALFALIVGFALFTSFGSQILAAWLGGKWVLGRFSPTLAEHKFYPVLLGAVLVGLLVNLPGFGWLFGMLIMFFGLGALWLWGRERMSNKPVEVVTQ